MDVFDIRIDPEQLQTAISETIVAVPRFGDSLTTDAEDTVAMGVLLRTLRTSGALTAVRQRDGLCLGVQPALRAGITDEGDAFEDLEVTLVRQITEAVDVRPGGTIRTQKEVTQVLWVTSVNATALLDRVDPTGQASAMDTARLLVDAIATVLREAVNNSAQIFAAA